MARPANEPVVLPQPESDIEVLFKRFRNLGGSPFLGKESIMETQAWIHSVEKIFEGLKLRGDQKRLLASWALKEEALFCWDSVIKDNPEGDITWDRFKVIFLGRFTPPEATSRSYREIM